MNTNRIFYPEFISFMVECGALLFGDFVLKSGRRSPYFINTGEYKTGYDIARLGSFYAKLIQNSVRPEDEIGAVDEELTDEEIAVINNTIREKFNVLFGPAYKGIPLVTSTASLFASQGLVLKVSYNRKERKTHGEGDSIMGYCPQDGDRIAIIEDVTTAGTSVRETFDLLRELNISAKIVSLYVSVDRMERGTGKISAMRQLEEEYGLHTHSIATVADVVEYLENTPENCHKVPDAEKHAKNIRAYLKQYGAL